MHIILVYSIIFTVLEQTEESSGFGCPMMCIMLQGWIEDAREDSSVTANERACSSSDYVSAVLLAYCTQLWITGESAGVCAKCRV